MSKKLLQTNLPKVFASLCGIAVVGGLATLPAKADEWDKKTVLTIHEPVQVRERLLEPGTYVFKLLNSPSDRHIVQIFNEDQSHIIDTVLAIPNYRLEPTGKSRFSFWETPPGYAKALRSWYYPGDNFGQEFPYPKHLAPVEMASSGITITRTPVPAPAPAPQEQQQVAKVEPQPVTKPAEPPPYQETARNTPPPAPEPSPAPVPEAAPAAPSPEPQAPAPAQTLPKTASNYAAIGLCGLCCLVLFGLVRDKGIKRQM